VRPENPPAGAVSPPPEDETSARLREEIAHQRDELDAVIDELSVRLTPSRLTHEAVAGARRKLDTIPRGRAIGTVALSVGSTLVAYKLGRGILGFAKKHPWLTAAAVGTGAWAWWRNQDQEAMIAQVQHYRDDAQRRIDAAREQTLQRIEDLRVQAQSTAEQWQGEARHAADRLAAQAHDALERARAQARQATDKAGAQAEQLADAARQKVRGEAKSRPCRPGDDAETAVAAAQNRTVTQIDKTREAAGDVHATAAPRKPAGEKAKLSPAEPTPPTKQAPQE
jgi:hypothetical protein